MKIDEMYVLQRELDEEIARKVKKGYDVNSHYAVEHIRYAFHTEMAELGNEVGFFKFWKNSHVIKRGETLEELADCLHFLLKLAIMKGYDRSIKEVEPFPMWEDCPVDEMFYEIRRNELDSMGKYQMALMYLLGIARKLDFSEADVLRAYKLKNTKNRERQAKNY